MGHKKAQMKMSQGTDARQVSCPKRRSGLFKKASELCTLCAVETALVIFSPSGKILPPGHPAVETIIKQLALAGKPDSGLTQLAETEHEATLRALNKEYHDLLEQLEAEKKRGEKLAQLKMETQRQGKTLIDTPVDELNLTELLTLKAMLEEFQGKLIKHMKERSAKSSAANSAEVIDPFATDPAEGSSVNPGN